jgi:hypothetical protein
MPYKDRLKAFIAKLDKTSNPDFILKSFPIEIQKFFNSKQETENYSDFLIFCYFKDRDLKFVFSKSFISYLL